MNFIMQNACCKGIQVRTVELICHQAVLHMHWLALMIFISRAVSAKITNFETQVRKIKNYIINVHCQYIGPLLKTTAGEIVYMHSLTRETIEAIDCFTSEALLKTRDGIISEH